MSQEIIEFIRGLEREKGIEENTVVGALEDADELDDLLGHLPYPS